MSLFRTKPLASLLAQVDEKGGLKRVLKWPGLIALGIGAVIGAGIFVRTAAAAGQNAGPAVTLSFVVAAIACFNGQLKQDQRSVLSPWIIAAIKSS